MSSSKKDVGKKGKDAKDAGKKSSLKSASKKDMKDAKAIASKPVKKDGQKKDKKHGQKQEPKEGKKEQTKKEALSDKPANVVVGDVLEECHDSEAVENLLEALTECWKEEAKARSLTELEINAANMQVSEEWVKKEWVKERGSNSGADSAAKAKKQLHILCMSAERGHELKKQIAEKIGYQSNRIRAFLPQKARKKELLTKHTEWATCDEFGVAVRV